MRFLNRGFMVFLVAVLAISSTGAGAVSEFSRAWKSANSSIVLDAYEYTVIDWSKIRNNQRLAGFINKATDGLRPRSRCGKNSVCRLRWRRYSAAKELYHTRKTLAKTFGLKWGAYHLGRPGNPIKQARHFLEFARPGPDDLIAIDIEENNPKRWMSLKEAEIFSQYIYDKLGRYPVLYTNHNTAQYIARNRAKLPLLSRLNLWYARYRPSMRGAFPMGNWDSYTIWQFSAHTNCSPQSCLWRINGTDHWIDVNVVNMPPAELRRKWPFNKLTARMPASRAPLAVAKAGVDTLTGYAAEKQLVSATKMFAALLGKPNMTLKGDVPLPKWRPGTKVFAVADKPIQNSEVVEAPVPPRPEVEARKMIAQISPRNTQQVNALLLETAKNYLAASRYGGGDWVRAVQPKPEPVTIVAPQVVMAVKGPVPLPQWREESRPEKGVVASKTATTKPPVMAVRGKVIVPNWRPDTELAKADAVEKKIKAAPKMAIAGVVAVPSWRPGSKVRQTAENTSGQLVELPPTTSGFVIPTTGGNVKVLTMAVPTWRPKSG